MHRHEQDESLREILDRLSHEQLMEILEEIANRDPHVMTMLFARFGAQVSDLQANRSLVRAALDLGKGQYGFIDYRGSGRAARGIGEVLSRGFSALGNGELQVAEGVFFSVLQELVPAMSHADDSSGELGTCVSMALEGVQAASHGLAGNSRSLLLERLLEEALSEHYQGWDWGWDLAEIAAEMVESADERARVEAALDDLATSRKDQDSAFLSDFDQRRAAKIKLLLVKRLDNSTQYETFLRDRIGWIEFRLELVDYLIERGDLEEPKRLCEEWLATSSVHKRGYVSDVLEQLLTIARNEGNSADVIALTEQLLLETGQIRYFERLKALNEADWPRYRHRLLQTMATSRSSVVTAEIYVIEEMWPELLEFVANSNRYAVDHYREHLDPRYPDQMSQLYERIARQVLIQEVNRKGYRTACAYLGRLHGLGYNDRLMQVIDELSADYRRRPALQDELSRLRSSFHPQEGS